MTLMRAVGIGMAEGQLAQADAILAGARPAHMQRMGRYAKLPAVEVALLHMRSACGWLIAAAEAV